MRCGLDRHTGEILLGWDECLQSIEIIVTTAIGALVLARDFGSGASELVDRPMNRATVFDFQMATAEALRRDEPGYRLRRFSVAEALESGRAVFELAGDFYPFGHRGDYSIVERDRTAAILGPLSLAAIIGAAS